MFPAHTMPVFGTPICLNLEVEFVAEDGSGKGLVSLEKELVWPGAPQIGHTYAETEVGLRPDGYKLRDVCFDGHGDRSKIPHLQAYLEECNLSEYRKRRNEIDAKGDQSKIIPVNRELFLDCVSEYLEDDWVVIAGHWWSADNVRYRIMLDEDCEPVLVEEK